MRVEIALFSKRMLYFHVPSNGYTIADLKLRIHQKLVADGKMAEDEELTLKLFGIF
jgi:hypothetical protein